MADSTQEHLIFVDDDEQFLNLVSSFCEEAQVHCQVANKWQDNLIENSDNNELLILDLQMPDIDGMDILQILAQQEYQGYIALMSGLDSSILESALKFASLHKLNIIQKLRKPFSYQQFQGVIEKYRQLRNTTQEEHATPTVPLLTEKEMREAIEYEWFYPAYQPQINMASGGTEGVECLARLKHPEKGQIPPTDFIPLLESQDMISRFTLNIVKRALREIATIFGKGYEFNVAFNISAKSLNREFCQELFGLVDASNVAPRLITLEITESSAINVNNEAQFSLSKLRIKGFNLSIDDFGTGYSTIKQLDELPFNEIKLDRSFVENLHSKDTTRAIVAATSLLARNLNYRFVGEGVESKEQLEFLSMHQCAAVQGFLFSKPLSVMELSAYLYNEKHSDTPLFVGKESTPSFSSEEQKVAFLSENSESANNFIEAFKFYVTSGFDVLTLNGSVPDLSSYNQIVLCGNKAIERIKELSLAKEQQLFVVKEITTQKDLEIGLDSGVTDVFEWSIFPHELLQRLNNAFRYSEQLGTTESQLESSTQVAMNAMQEASQYGALLQFVKNILHVKNKEQLLKDAIKYLNSNGYSVAIQLRDGASKYSQLNDQAECPVMIEKIFDTLAQHSKLYQFNSRLLCNTPDVSILFLQLPEDDVKLGLLKDIAATIIDVLEEKWIELREHHLLENIAHKLVHVSNAISSTVTTVKEESGNTLNKISEELYQSFHVIDLNEEQELYLMNLIRQNMTGTSIEEQLLRLSSLVFELESLANSALKPEPEPLPEEGEAAEIVEDEGDDDIELF